MAPAAAPMAASRLVFFFMVVVPDDVEAVEPLDPDVPEDPLVERRGAELDRVVVREAATGATGAATRAFRFCSRADIESI